MVNLPRDKPSMFISKEELDKRSSIDHDVVSRLKLHDETSPPDPNGPGVRLDTTRFRKNGTTTNMPLLDDDMRAVVGAACIVAGPEVAAEIGNVSERYAALLGRPGGFGEHITDPEERLARNQKIRDSIYQGLSKVRDAAQDKIILALGLIDEESLQAIAPKDRARLAAQMANQLSSVIDRTINKGEHLHDERTSHLHLYAPERRPLDAFNVKIVNQMPLELEKDNGNGSGSTDR
jgi:hypothetical protein